MTAYVRPDDPMPGATTFNTWIGWFVIVALFTLWIDNPFLNGGALVYLCGLVYLGRVFYTDPVPVPSRESNT